MDHERAFFQAIREAPHDDAPRLIYADWLEEQGGGERSARAAFIRIQCRLAELAEDDSARDALEDEEADLLAEYEHAWTEPLHGIAEEWKFGRGFIEHLGIRGENLFAHAERLFDFAPLRSLHLLMHFKDVPHLAACPQLQEVEALDFHRCHLNDRALQHLLTSPYLTRLHTLDLVGNGITTAGMQTLLHSHLFPRLRRLDLSNNIAIGDRAVHLLARATHGENLQELILSATNATTASLHELIQSPHLPRLIRLDLSALRFSREPPLRMTTPLRLLGQLRHLDLSNTFHAAGLPLLLASLATKTLQTLRLSGIRLESENVRAFAESPHLESLTTLDLSKNNLGSEGVQALAFAPFLASLRQLDVSYNNLRDSGAKALAESPHGMRLRALHLQGNGIGGPGLQALASSTNFEQLRILSLGGNFIGPDSVRALTESFHLRHLRCFDLSDAYLEEESGRTLASAPYLERLTTLRLAKNQLGDGGAKALAQSTHLQRLAFLDLIDNRIGKAGAEALAATAWRRMRQLDLRGNVFTATQENLLRGRFGDAVIL
jgi:uncharacterized protein (TIGR02996 family)